MPGCFWHEKEIIQTFSPFIAFIFCFGHAFLFQFSEFDFFWHSALILIHTECADFWTRWQQHGLPKFTACLLSPALHNALWKNTQMWSRTFLLPLASTALVGTIPMGTCGVPICMACLCISSRIQQAYFLKSIHRCASEWWCGFLNRPPCWWYKGPSCHLSLLWPFGWLFVEITGEGLSAHFYLIKLIPMNFTLIWRMNYCPSVIN